jgi:hypothetical protein
MDERPASISQLQLQLQEKDQRISQLQVLSPPPPPPQTLTRSHLVFRSPSLRSLLVARLTRFAPHFLDVYLSTPPPPPTSLSTVLQHVASAGWIEEVPRMPSV